MKSLLVFVSILLGAAAMAAPPAGGYHLLKRIPVPGEGGWDYLIVDESARRLYISHATKVDVIDIESEAAVGTIPAQGVHGIAFATDLGRGFVSNGQSAAVTIFDLKTLHVVGAVETGKNPDAIIYDPATKRVFAFNGASSNATVIEAANGKVAGTIEVGGKPEFAVADGAGRVFVNVEDKNEVLRIDSRKLAIMDRWPMAGCEEPSGLTMDRESRRLFSGCGNRVMAVTNADTGRAVATVLIGQGVDATSFDPGTNLVFNSNGDGTLTVVHEDSPESYRVVENVQTQRGARTMALDPKTHKVFLSVAQLGPRPAPTPEQPRPRPSIVPGTFTILVLGR
ncbi:MAG: YncE family protein [Acidobacteria bacterium]|nr:YncE family protein [Acidobacteriota bacterium]